MEKGGGGAAEVKRSCSKSLAVFRQKCQCLKLMLDYGPII